MGQIFITAALNASASFLLKKANSFSEPIWHYGLLGLGLLIYGVSFLFYIYVLKKYDASLAYTFVTGLTVLILSLASYALLGESFSMGKISGMILVTLGIIVLTLYA